jgi:hypothetical protein
VTAGEIISEITLLPPKEQVKLITFIRQLGDSRQLTGQELNHLANEMVHSDDPAEVEILKEKIVAGFFGPQMHA